MEDLEDLYKREIEYADNDFLDKSKNSANNENLEKNYKKKLKSIQDKYERELKKFLLLQKRNRKVKKINKETGKVKSFHVEGISLKSTFKERLKFKSQILVFRFRIVMHDFFNKITPNFMLKYKLKAKKSIKKTFANILEFFSNSFSALIDIIKANSSTVKDIIVKVVSKIKEISSKITNKLLSLVKKKKSEDKEKKEEENKASEKVK